MRASLVSFAIGTLASSLHAAAATPAWAATPATPGDTTVLLDWNSATGAASYKVRYRTSDTTDAWTTVSGLPLSPTSYTVTALANQKSYEFQVGATDSGGTTTWNTDWHARPRGSLHTSGMPAGGQVNGITRAAAGIMIVGTDVGGFQRSTDGGTTWRQSSAGTHIDSGTHVISSVIYHSSSGTLFGLSGGGGKGHFWSSTDNGQTWTWKATSTDLYADAVGSDYPRDVGKLIAVDPANANTIFVGTFNKGVMKSTNGGTSWTNLVLNGSQINGLAYDGGFLYIAAANDAVYRCTPSGGSLTKFTGTASPGNPEELLVLGGKLYAVVNTAGVRRLNSASTASATASWTNLNVGGTTAQWCAIDGYVSGTNHVIVVGNSAAEQNGTSGRYTTLMKCTNAQATSGFTWTNISSASGITVDITMAAGNGETYWRIDPTKSYGYGASWGPDKRVDGANFNIDQVFIDPDDTNKIHVVGQMGIWRSLDGGTSWKPAVIGLSNAVLNTVIVDPANPGRVYVGDSDHFLWVIDDYAESMNYVTEPPAPDKPICIALDIDTNGLIYAGLETAAGSIWTFDRGTKTWAELADNRGNTLRTIANTTGKTVHGVKVQFISGSRVVLAAVEDSGIWRLAAGGNWTKVQSTTMTGLGSIKTMPFAWPSSNKQLVYFYDQSTGVWRSSNAGQTWTNIWSTGFTSQFAGSIALRTSNSQLFVTTNDTLYRLDNADTASNPTATNLNIANAGKLTAHNDTLWVACYADGPGGTGTDKVKLYRSTDGTNFTAFTNNYYQGATPRVTGVAADGSRQYVTGGAMGITVSEN